MFDMSENDEGYVTWLQYTFVEFREGILQHSFP